MKRFLRSEIGAAVLWVVCAVALAAAITPWVYQAGKHLASAAAMKDLPAVAEWLGAACGRSKFPRFFDRCLMGSALVLLPLLLRRLRTLQAAVDGGPLVVGWRAPWRAAAVHVALGWVIAGGVLWALGAVLGWAGAYAPRSHVHAIGAAWLGLLGAAAVVSLLEEWLFRGLLLGLWRRFSGTAWACLGTSLLFAFVHFLKPPDGVIACDPTDALAGFWLLGKILLHFTEPLFFVTDFATLLGVGLILAWVRVRTGRLWFCIGLHAGWITAFKGFNLLYQDVHGHFLRPWGVGDNLRSGVLPLVALGVTAVICHFALRRLRLDSGDSVSPASR